jgi:hypothetical protein
MTLFSGPENVIWFFFGIASVEVWQWIKCKYKDRVDPEGSPHRMRKLNWFYVTMAATVLITIGIGIQNQRTYEFATNLARDTRECQIEFNRALKVRSDITTDNDKWSQVQRTALATWLHDILFPPPPYSNMAPDDPGRQAWALVRTQEADRIITEAQSEQAHNQVERERNPYPEPACGK